MELGAVILEVVFNKKEIDVDVSTFLALEESLFMVAGPVLAAKPRGHSLSAAIAISS